MTSHRTALFLIVLISLSVGCSKESPAPTPAAQTPVAAPSAAPAPVAATSPTAAPPSGALKTGDTNTAGIAADVIECTRKDGVLSVKVRFRNTSGEKKNLRLIAQNNYETYYVSAANKKYFILKDSEGSYLAPPAVVGYVEVNVDAGGQYTWWAKYPAPLSEVKAVTLYMPVAPPLEDIPISDR